MVAVDQDGPELHSFPDEPRGRLQVGQQVGFSDISDLKWMFLGISKRSFQLIYCKSTGVLQVQNAFSAFFVISRQIAGYDMNMRF